MIVCYVLRTWFKVTSTLGGAWKAAVHRVTESRTRLSDFTFTFHFHALEEEMATHSSVLAWRIPGTGKPGGLRSMGSHRVGHSWSDLAIAIAIETLWWWVGFNFSIETGWNVVFSPHANSHIPSEFYYYHCFIPGIKANQIAMVNGIVSLINSIHHCNKKNKILRNIST